MTSSQNGDGLRERWLFLGSGLLLSAAVLFGLAREQRWGEPMLQLQLLSVNAGGLRAGQEVRISGLPVGQVRHLQLLPDARVAVKLQVERRYASLIGPKSVASQNQEGLVGDHYLEISADPQPQGRVSSLNGRTIRYEPPIAVATLMQQLLQAQRELTTTLRNTSRLTATDLPQTLREARRSLNGVSELATALRRESASTAPELRQALRQLSRTGTSAEQTSTQAQQLIRQSQPLLIRTLDDLQQITSASRRLLHSLMGLTGTEEAPAPAASPATSAQP
jgi:phospholipid/cholesterol/gamma-HCH transport system substrate-binding protein